MQIVFPELDPLRERQKIEAQPDLSALTPREGADLSSVRPVELTSEAALETLERISAEPEGNFAKAIAAQAAAGRIVRVSGCLTLNKNVDRIPPGWEFDELWMGEARIPILNHIKAHEFFTNYTTREKPASSDWRGHTVMNCGVKEWCGYNESLRQIGPDVEIGAANISSYVDGLNVEISANSFSSHNTNFGGVKLKIGNGGASLTRSSCQSLAIQSQGEVKLEDFTSPKVEILALNNIRLETVEIADLAAVTTGDIEGKWRSNKFGTAQLKSAGQINFGAFDSPDRGILSADKVVLAAEKDVNLYRSEIGNLTVSANGNVNAAQGSIGTAVLCTEGNINLNRCHRLDHLTADAGGTIDVSNRYGWGNDTIISSHSFAGDRWITENSQNVQIPEGAGRFENSRTRFRASINSAFSLPPYLAVDPATLRTAEPVVKR